MSKKKIATLLIAGTLTVGLVGGTLAWFTSSDSITNEFSTGLTDEKKEESGVKIHENFDEDKADNVTPGTTVRKQVQVHNTAHYDQFIRVKLTPKFVGKNEEEVKSQFGKNLDVGKIILNKSTYGINTKAEGTWYDGGDGYYYYVGKVAGTSFTNTLLESVTLDATAGNEYKNLTFEVKVDAEAIQASHDAYKDWKIAALDAEYSNLQQKENKTTPTSAEIKNN